MEKFRGRPVLGVVPADLEFLSDLVFALDDSFGPTTYIRQTPALLDAWLNFRDAVCAALDSFVHLDDSKRYSFDTVVVYLSDQEGE